jgi:hypothetical protein
MAREKFTIRLSEAEKTAYEEHRKEHTDIESLSHWFRDLADREVDSPVEDDTSALDEALLRSIISGETREIKNELSNLTRELAELDDAIRTGEKTTHFAEEAYRIFSGEEPQNIDEYPRNTSEDTPDGMTPEWYARNSGLPDAFATYFDISTEEARRALVRCENMFPAIESKLNDAGYRYWYRADAVTREGSENVGDGV